MAVQVKVYASNSEKAIRDLKRKMQRELVYRVMKMSRHFEPPSVARRRKSEEGIRRAKRSERHRRLSA